MVSKTTDQKPDIVMNIGYFHSIYFEKYCLAKEKMGRIPKESNKLFLLLKFSY